MPKAFLIFVYRPYRFDRRRQRDSDNPQLDQRRAARIRTNSAPLAFYSGLGLNHSAQEADGLPTTGETDCLLQASRTSSSTTPSPASAIASRISRSMSDQDTA